MLINWSVVGWKIIADVPGWKAVVTDCVTYFRVDLIPSATGATSISKECNNLIEALHWAEDELKYNSKGKE